MAKLYAPDQAKKPQGYALRLYLPVSRRKSVHMLQRSPGKEDLWSAEIGELLDAAWEDGVRSLKIIDRDREFSLTLRKRVALK